MNNLPSVAWKDNLVESVYSPEIHLQQKGYR